MSASLMPAATAISEAARSLERALASSRAQWDDAARHAFDRRFADPIQTDSAKASGELQQLAEDLAAAIRTLNGLG